MIKFEVRPIEKEKWHGKKSKEVSITQPKSPEVLFDVGAGRYATGLTEEEAIKYGKLLGMDLSSTGNPNEPHPTWSQKSMWLNLPNRTLILNLENPMDYVKSRNYKASKFVAGSMKGYEEGLYPDATHVIYDEEEDVAIKATKVERKQKAQSFIPKLSKEDKAAIILVMTNNVVRNKSDNFLNVEIDRLAENETEGFIKVCEVGRTDLTLRAKIQELNYMTVLTREGDAYFYMSEQLGRNIEETILWFKNPDNQALKIKILEKLNQ